MNFFIRLQILFQSFNRFFKILFLTLVFSKNILVYLLWFNIIFMEFIKYFLSFGSEFVLILYKLNSLINTVLKFLDSHILEWDQLSLLFDVGFHCFEFLIKGINYITKIIIEISKIFELLIHHICFLFHSIDFLISRSCVSLKLLDFVIKNKFEFLQLLWTLFQFIYFSLFFSYSFILLLNLFELFFYRSFELVILFLQLFFLFLIIFKIFILLLFLL